MDPITSLRDHTARVIRDFVAGGPKGACSRLTVLALTALGILATGGAGSIAALLSGFGINIGASALFEQLRKLSDKGPCGPTLDDALAAVQALGEQEQRSLQQIADRVEVMPMLLSEALAQHRQELLADFGGLLTAWGSTLPFARIEAMLARIGEQTAGISPVQAEVQALQARLAALQAGLRDDLDDQLAPLAADVRALRGQVNALLAQLSATGAAVPTAQSGRSRRRHPGRILTDEILAAMWEEIHRETGDLLS